MGSSTGLVGGEARGTRDQATRKGLDHRVSAGPPMTQEARAADLRSTKGWPSRRPARHEASGRYAGCTDEEVTMGDDQGQARWSVAEWHGKMLLDRDGEKIGKLQDVYVDVETDEPQFATVKEGFIGRHLTFVPLGGIQIRPDDLQVSVTKEQVRSAPEIQMHGEELSQADESTLYHHYELNYTPPDTDSGRRLARR